MEGVGLPSVVLLILPIDPLDSVSSFLLFNISFFLLPLDLLYFSFLG